MTHNMWYYQQGENRIGPVSEEMIRNLLISQILNTNSLVWREGMSSWVSVHQTQLADGLPLPPPPLPQAQNTTAKERYIYILLAVFPLTGGLGIHNFYAAHKNAQIQLLLGLLCCWPVMWIWAIIEACTVTKDGNGVDLK